MSLASGPAVYAAPSTAESGDGPSAVVIAPHWSVRLPCWCKRSLLAKLGDSGVGRPGRQDVRLGMRQAVRKRPSIPTQIQIDEGLNAYSRSSSIWLFARS